MRSTNYRNTIPIVLGLEDVQFNQRFLGVIHIHPVAVKESELIKIATLPNYQIPGDAYGRYPVQLLNKIAQVFFAVIETRLYLIALIPRKAPRTDRAQTSETASPPRFQLRACHLPP